MRPGIRDSDAVAEEDRSGDPSQRERLVRSHHQAWLRGDPQRPVTRPRGEQVRGRRATCGPRVRLPLKRPNLNRLDTEVVGGLSQEVVRADLENRQIGGRLDEAQRAPFRVEDRP